MRYLSTHILDLLRRPSQARYTLWQCERIDATEPLLQDQPDATPLALPYSDTELGSYVDLLRDSHWRHEEVHMGTDAEHYKQIDADTRQVLDTILRFFAIGDNLVVENLLSRFGNEIKRDVVVTFYSFQISNEEEHKLTYARLINTIIESEEKRRIILNDDEPALRLMAQWISHWILDRRTPFATRLLAFVFVEGVFFTSCFAFIYWLRNQNRFPGLGKSNEFIARDENLHALFACALYRRHVRHRLSRDEIEELAVDAMTVCDAFIETMFDGGRIRLLGMNDRLLKTYVRHVTNYYMAEIGEEPVFPLAHNPFPFMIQQSLEGKTNFFESDVSEYKKAVDVLATQYSEDTEF